MSEAPETFQAGPTFLSELRRTLLRPRWILVGALLVAGLAALPWLGRGPVRAFVSDTLGLQRVEALADEIGRAASESGVDPHLLSAICFMESRGQVDAVSSAQALGLMQLMPSAAGDAAQRLGIEAPTRAALLADPSLNLRLGANHLRWLLDLSEGWELDQVLVSYNAGRARLFSWIEAAGSWEQWRSKEERRIERGEAHTGSLAYAQRVLTMRDYFAQR